jgi:hypothetical protein
MSVRHCGRCAALPKRGRGFTRPPARITRDLIDAGVIDPELYWPLWAIYRSGVRASHFGLPQEFVEFVTLYDE